MSVIIRLQNLPWSANAVDIRGFFRGLSIPDGGVHIVGGEMGDAFIAFSTDEDARQAMLLDRGKINEVQVRLLLSSRAEMQKVIETARNSSKSIMQSQQEKSPQKKFHEDKSPQMVQLQRSPHFSQGPPLQAPQPPIITPSTLKNILSQPVQQHNFTMKDNPIMSYQPFSQYNENATDPRNSRDSSRQDDRRGSSPFQRSRDRDRGRDRYQSRSRSRDRRRSRSRDYGGSRRRRDRSASDSPDRRDRRRRSRSRDRSRDRNRNDSRRRDRERDFRSRDDQIQSNNGPRFAVTQKDPTPDKIGKSSAMDIDQGLNKEVYSPTQNTLSNDRNNYPRAGNLFSPSLSMSLGMNQSYQSNLARPTNFSGIEKQIQSQSAQQPNAFQSVREHPFSPKKDFEKFSLQIQQSADNSSETSQNDSNKTQIVQTKSNDSLNFQNYFNANLMANLNYFGSNAKSTPFQNPYTIASNQSNEGSVATTTTATTTMLDEKKDDVKVNVFGMFENKSIKEAALIRKPSDDMMTPNMEKDSGLESDSILSDMKKTPVDANEINYDEIKGNCIKVSNMCPSTSYSDIRRFFSGLYIATNGIKMINDKHGLRIGIAYIRFVRHESKPKAFTRNGLNLKSKRVVVESCTEDEFEEAVDSFKPVRKMHHFDHGKQDVNSNKNQNDEFDERKSSQTMNMEREPPCTTLVLEDVPLFASEQDIMRMFSSYSLVDIVLDKDEDGGRKKLVGFVKFHRPEDVKDALKDKSKHLIGHKRVFVSKCTEETFQKVKQQQATLEVERKEALEEESVHDEEKEQFNPFIQDMGKSSDDIEMKDNPSDDKFSTPFSKIFNESNSSTDDKPLIPSLLSLRTMQGDPRRRGQDNVSNNLETRFVMIRNCDYRCKKQNFADLFLESRLVPFRIEILINNRNQPSGECIIEFRTCEDAKKALLKNNSMCGTRNIRMELIPQSVVADRLGEDFLKQTPPSNDFSPNIPPPFNPEINPPGRDFRFEMTNQLMNMIRPPFSDNGNMPSENNSPNSGPNMFRSGGNMSHNNNNNGIRNRMDDTRAMGRRGRKSRFSDYNDNGKRFMGNNMNPGNNGPLPNIPPFPKPNIPQSLNNATVDQFGKPGCVVCLENVPYKATIDHIIDFFHKFKVQPHNVIRRYNDDGTATGDARVAFSSPLEARAAIENKKHQKIFNRDIFLSLL